MAALLRQGARRIVGSVLQRTQAAVTSPAVAEERRRLLPRRFSTSIHAHTREAMLEVQQKKEELYDVLSKAGNLRDRGLLQDLIVGHVNPRPHETQWRNLRVAWKMSNFIEITGTAMFVSFVYIFNSVTKIYEEAVKQVAAERENELKMHVAMERQNQGQSLIVGEASMTKINNLP